MGEELLTRSMADPEAAASIRSPPGFSDDSQRRPPGDSLHDLQGAGSTFGERRTFSPAIVSVLVPLQCLGTLQSFGDLPETCEGLLPSES